MAVKEFTVTGNNFSFSPNVITVKKGDKVKITFNNTQGFHDFKIDEYGVATKQAQSPDTEVLEFIADKTGAFQYYCSVGSHRKMGMWGTLKVE
jgi:plastocyanin